ncbi:MAG: tyrosine-protein phosphatase [Phycisphaerae bacterium]
MNVPRWLRRLFRAPYDGLRHFGVVSEGVLYRCGQPTPAQLEDLITRLSLKSVVSLRGTREADDPDGWEQGERAVCERRGVEFVPIPCNHKNPPTADQVERFLDLTRRADKRPVLVHCRLGQQRTMLFCGLYRVRVEGMSTADALHEMDAGGFGTHVRRHRLLLSSFHEHSKAARPVA